MTSTSTSTTTSSTPAADSGKGKDKTKKKNKRKTNKKGGGSGASIPIDSVGTPADLGLGFKVSTRGSGAFAPVPDTKSVAYTPAAAPEGENKASVGLATGPPSRSAPSADAEKAPSRGRSGRQMVLPPAGKTVKGLQPTEDTNDSNSTLAAPTVSLSDVLGAMSDPNKHAVGARLAAIGVARPVHLNDAAFINEVMSDVIALKIAHASSKFDVAYVPRLHVTPVYDPILNLDVAIVRDFWGAYDVQTLPTIMTPIHTMQECLSGLYVPSGRCMSHSANAWERVVHLYNFYFNMPGALYVANPLLISRFGGNLPKDFTGAFSWKMFSDIVDSRVCGIDFVLELLGNGSNLAGTNLLHAVAKRFGGP